MKLKKELSLPEVFSISTGAMISSGLFILPGLAFSKAGPAVVLSYMLAALFVIPSMLSKAELATAMPKSGGVYFFLERSLGPIAGIFGGLANWFSLSFKSAFALVGMGVFATLVFPGITELHVKLIACSFCILFAALNIVSVKHTGRLQVLLVAFLLVTLLVYTLLSADAVKLDKFVPFMPFGSGSVLATAGLVFVSFGGLTKIASVGEEIKDPGRNIPLAMIMAFAVVTALYLVVIATTVAVLDPDTLANSLTPISDGARVFLGTPGVIITAVAAIIAFITTANAGILSASRDPMAMSRDSLIPKFFQKVNNRFRTPHVSIIATCGFMVTVILFFSLENLIKVASTLKILLFMFVNVSLIMMRESKIHNYKPKFKAPFYPWLQLGGILAYGALIIGMGTIPILITGVFLSFGFVWYWGYAKKRVDRRPAIEHVYQRLRMEGGDSDTLTEELKEILMDRDEIVEDRFDHIISKSRIIDLKGSVVDREAFLKISKKIAPDLGLDEKNLLVRFMRGEGQMHTIVHPGVAIPHLRVPVKNTFMIIPVRAKNGIYFQGVSRPVFIMFVLVSSPDEDIYRLHAVNAICQFVHDPEFVADFITAKSKNEMKDLILLAKRKRVTW